MKKMGKALPHLHTESSAASQAERLPAQKSWATPAVRKVDLSTLTLGGFAATNDGNATGFPS